MQNSKHIQAQSLSSQVYLHLRQQLMSAQFHPGDRLKIRDLARSFGTSETPVREALLRLVNDGALEMKAGSYIRVRQVNLREYLEIRKIRLLLEPYALVQALPNIDNAFIDRLASLHDSLVRAERDGDYSTALRANYDFHFSIYRHSRMPHLIEILERLWIQIGSLLSLLYPYGPPTYQGDHQHLHMLRALRARDAQAAGEALEADMVEGGRNLLHYLEKIENSGDRDNSGLPQPNR